MGSSKFAALMTRDETSGDVQGGKPASPSVLDARTQRAMPVRRGRPPGKRSSESHVQVTAYIRRATHRAVKMELLKKDDERDFSELVDELLEKWLNS